MQINNKSAAIVTGGASGLGEASARALAAKGAKVAVFDRDLARARHVAEEIGGLAVGGDIADADSVAEAFAEAQHAHGGARILINCAGIGAVGKTAMRDRQTGAIAHHDLAQFAKVIDVNLLGTFTCIAKAAAQMMALDLLEEGERGVIINTASVAAQDGQVGQVAYATAKAGIAGMTLPIARDLMSEGIRVNAILPGIFDTPLMRSLPQKAQDSLAASVPFPKRFGKAEEFAQMVIALVENGYCNGENLRLDGAIRMPPR